MSNSDVYALDMSCIGLHCRGKPGATGTVLCPGLRYIWRRRGEGMSCFEVNKQMKGSP